MKITTITTGLIFSLAAMLLFMSCDQLSGTKKEVTLTTDLDSVSYAIGVDIAMNLKNLISHKNKADQYL